MTVSLKKEIQLCNILDDTLINMDCNDLNPIFMT